MPDNLMTNMSKREKQWQIWGVNTEIPCLRLTQAIPPVLLGNGEVLDTVETYGTRTGKDHRSNRADLYRKLFFKKVIVQKLIWRSLGNMDYIHRMYFSLGSLIYLGFYYSQTEEMSFCRAQSNKTPVLNTCLRSFIHQRSLSSLAFVTISVWWQPTWCTQTEIHYLN